MSEQPATTQGPWQSPNKTAKHHPREITPTVTPNPATSNRYAALELEDLTDNLVVQRIISATLRRQHNNNNNIIDDSNSIDGNDINDDNDIIGDSNIDSDDDRNYGINNNDESTEPVAATAAAIESNNNETVIEITNLPQGIGPTTGTSSSSSSSASSSTASTTSSDSSTDTMQHENSTYDELVCTLELLQENCTNPTNSKLDLTHIIRFRELLGTALAQVPCSKYSGGYAWLADDLNTYQGRIGTAVGQPNMPTRPREVPATATSSVYKEYKRELKHFLYCEKIRSASLGIIERKFPNELELKKTRLGLPLNFTIQNAFQHLEAEHGSELNRTETTLRIQKNVMTRSCLLEL